MARILIVDDEPLIAMLAGDWLDELGHVTVGPALSLRDAVPLVEDDLDGVFTQLEALLAQKDFAATKRARCRSISAG